MVDAHTKREYRNYKCFLSPDRKMGVAINSETGDVVSVFSRSPKERGSALNKLIPFAIANGGKKLDCYGGGLQNMYARWGAKATGQTPFNEEYAPPGWDGGNYPVVAMILPTSLAAAIRAYDPSARTDLKKIKTFYGDDGYDQMLKERDRKLAQRENKAFAVKRISDNSLLTSKETARQGTTAKGFTSA